MSSIMKFLNKIKDWLSTIWNYIKSWLSTVLNYISSIFNWMDDNFFKVLFVFFILKSFFFDISMIPSGSMTPSAMTGDFTLVNKFIYGINRNSIQTIGGYLPFFKNKIFSGSPKPGDPIIFTLPRDPKTIYCKRAIAIEGQTVQMKNGILHINDEPVLMEEISNFSVISDNGYDVENGKIYKITLKNGASYKIFRNCDFGKGHIDNTAKYIIPKGHVFAQGDNHTGSDDCFNMDFLGGPIPSNNVIGKPLMSICGSNSREESEPHWIAWFIGLYIRIPVYLYNLDTSRFFKKI